jgi:hypothetical protein
MDLRIFHPIEQHESYDRHGALLGNLSRFVKANFLSAHSAEIDPL